MKWSEMDESMQMALAVEDCVFASLANAWNERADPERSEYWFRHADKMERKFTTRYGKHYSYFVPQNRRIV